MNDEIAGPKSQVAPILRPFRDALDALSFPLPLGSQGEGELIRQDILNQLSDYVIPRYDSLEAPLLAVFGGSTGSGKSTLVNSILGENVSQASALRPITRRPILVHHPDDAHWFTGQRIFPHLARVTSHREETGEDIETSNELELRSSDRVPRGLALLDSPDIDSVVAENRQLAAQFLAAADLWVFVTTAARYADAIPWAMLDDAAQRNVVVAMILNRVPAGTGALIRPDLDRMLAERGLEHAPLFMLSEQELDDDGHVTSADVEPIRGWLEGLAEDAAVRASVARQTLGGTVDVLLADSEGALSAYDEQIAAVDALRWDVTTAFDSALDSISRAVSDGTMLRGEVLSRWQDVVGTGEWARKLEQGVSTLRDKITGFFRPQVDTAHVDEALEDSLYSLIVSEADQANAAVAHAWSRGIGGELAQQARSRISDSEQRSEAAAQLVRDWQSDLIAMIRAEGDSKRMTARALAFGVNAVGTALIIVVFASTGGLVGGEIAVAGGTAVLAQRVLEAVFGVDAVRKMAASARENLARRVKDFLSADADAWQAALDDVGISRRAREDFAVALMALRRAKDADRRAR
ncbi:dynamin family protein [Trueperella bialowiezensis]|uniref:Predicted GTPase n=1 Tax=Trueperella bialowiezensis TaxID=312285 RepID=A0A3S4X4G7_9ACTO|nr:dynamin family protein [Trueperella bialowiezensis]VEI12470.1 Predicted GTPase [Trueperella bialowiezensis]